MLNDMLIYGMGLVGIISLLMWFVFKMIAWRIEDFTITLPLVSEDKEIYGRIYNIWSFIEFCGIDKKCTIVLVNYDAPKWFCEEILNYYEKYGFLKIVPYDISIGKI